MGPTIQSTAWSAEFRTEASTFPPSSGVTSGQHPEHLGSSSLCCWGSLCQASFCHVSGKRNSLLVIDGQQRLRTLQYFYAGVFEPTARQFSLRAVQQRLEGSTYKALAPEDRRRLDDAIIHATIVQQDAPSNDDSSIYHVFERLNTGGLSLSAQEIRNCIYHGEFNALLHELNFDPAWRTIYGPLSKRMRDEELILRFLAFYFGWEGYEKPFKGFLNSFMGRNRHLTRYPELEIRSAFEPTVRLVDEALGSRPFRPVRALNAAVLDSVMVALARRLQTGPINDTDGIRRTYERLLADDSYLVATQRATADEDRVAARMNLAQEAFTGLD